MWTYRQSTGEIFRDGARVGSGYSGFGPHKNRAESERIVNLGPIPRGRYQIGERFNSESHGPICMRLSPLQGTETFGRTNFLIHGDNRNGTASHGCVILPRPIRIEMAASTDRELEVV